ncbi:hypothetical protein HanRHA438_Chr04g0176141 [Helianthus annuus]|nr:hypothetical protein HanIR_Chr04g0179571 [Helianthus annuus]KAJ0926857.1 hypothetical protein HanRHA438_Chr04g0176141 [Helianthus annuus]
MPFYYKERERNCKAYDNAMGPTVVATGNCPEPFLSSCVPLIGPKRKKIN